MSLRFQATNVTIPTTNGAIAHGLGQIPTEWSFNQRASSINTMFLSSIDATNIAVCASTAIAGDVFASLNHSICR